MRFRIAFIICLLLPCLLIGQETKTKTTKFIVGLSAPEILHAGVTFRIANSTLFGINAGIGPTMGGLWPTVSAEHRFYFGKNDSRIGQKTWFCRQGITFQPSAETTDKVALTLTVGKDMPFKKLTKGLTIDAGVFYLGGSELSSIILIRSLNLWPALRFEFYF
jgi:hypothetical protein